MPTKRHEYAAPPPLQDPLPGQAVLYLLRAPHDKEEVDISIGSKPVARLASGTYTVLSLPPGRHVIGSKLVAPGLFGGTGDPLPLEVTLAPNQRTFFYISQASTSASTTSMVPLPGGVVVPIFSNVNRPLGPRSWKECSEMDALGLITISRLTLPERIAL